MIAIVDDDRSVLTALGSLIRSLGYRVRLFNCAEDFVAAQMAGPDCLICDINLSGMSGWDLWKLMEETGQIVPTILITAYLDEMDKTTTRKGLTIFAKPFDADTLAEAILRLTAPAG